MSGAAKFAPVRKSVTVAVSREKAFAVFAGRIGKWWNPSHSIGASPQIDVTIEPHAGGRLYETGADGTQCDWGRVAVWAPPVRLVLVWCLDARWRFDSTFETEVEIVFSDLGDGRTRVDLEHRLLDRYGADAGKVRDSLDSSNGWMGLLDRFAGLAGL